MQMNDIKRTEAFENADKTFVWHPFTQMKDWLGEKPLIIEEGRDCFVRDTSGNWYLDGVSSLWVNIHGHRRIEIDDAIRGQLDKIAHSTLLGLANIPSIELAEKLITLADNSFAGLSRRLSKVFYSDNGSTAVEIALKMAFQYRIHSGQKKKTKFIAVRNGYHGDTIGAMSAGSVEVFHATFGPLFFETFKAPSPHCYRCELGKSLPECSFACLESMKRIMDQHAGEVTAVILEPLVQAAGGMIVWPEGYLRGVRELCDKYDVLLIADEVATGFGRTGKMFACEHEQVVPDLMCLSKGITNGYMPLAVTLVTEEIFNAFLGEFSELKTFFHGHSYTGNPLACAAALASLKIFDSDSTLLKMAPKNDIIYNKLSELGDMPHIGNVRNKGLMAGVELVRDKSTRKEYDWGERVGWKVAYEMRKRGVLIRPLGNVIVIMPPLAISEENLTRLLESLKESIHAVTG